MMGPTAPPISRRDIGDAVASSFLSLFFFLSFLSYLYLLAVWSSVFFSAASSLTCLDRASKILSLLRERERSHRPSLLSFCLVLLLFSHSGFSHETYIYTFTRPYSSFSLCPVGAVSGAGSTAPDLFPSPNNRTRTCVRVRRVWMILGSCVSSVTSRRRASSAQGAFAVCQENILNKRPYTPRCIRVTRHKRRVKFIGRV